MGDRAVLMSRHVTFGINDSGAEDVAPLLPHIVGVTVCGHCRPEGGIGKPFIPEGGLWARARIMQPKELTQGRHLFLVARNGEMRKVFRWGSAGRRKGKTNGDKK